MNETHEEARLVFSTATEAHFFANGKLDLYFDPANQDDVRFAARLLAQTNAELETASGLGPEDRAVAEEIAYGRLGVRMEPILREVSLQNQLRADCTTSEKYWKSRVDAGREVYNVTNTARSSESNI